MGLKSGSRDAGLDDPDDDSDESAASTEPEPEPQEEAPDTASPTDQPATETPDQPATDTTETTPSSMPDTTPERSTETTTEPTREPQPEPDTATSTSTASTGAEGRPEMSAIPYKMRREKVNEGRDQVPFFLRKEIIEAEDDLQDALEAQLGEDVYKSDYREAAMVVAQRNPELVAEVLREWGYDLD